jgi:hypothetical protein
METQQRLSIIEKLRAQNHVGVGMAGFVPFDVYTTGDACGLDKKIAEQFNKTKSGQVGTIFIDNNKFHLPVDLDSITVILKDSQRGHIDVVAPDIFIVEGEVLTEGYLSRLPYLIYNLAERKREEKGFITLHGAAVAKDGKGILIVGDKGSGKTSLMLGLCLNQGYKIIGNDIVIISGRQKINLVSGTKQINVRLPVGRRFGFDMSSSNERKDVIDYEVKKSFMPVELNIKSTSKLTDLSMVVRANIHSANPDFVSSAEFSRETEALRLSENVSRYIRGLPTPVVLNANGVGGNFPSLDTDELSNFRNTTVNRLLSLPYFYISSNNPQTAARRLSEMINLL